jgi:hypothetical protein
VRFLTKLIRFSPPRGTIKSTFALVFKKGFQFGYNSNTQPKSSNIIVSQGLMPKAHNLRLESKDSLPPFSKILFPDLNAIPPASTVTSGLDS